MALGVTELLSEDAERKRKSAKHRGECLLENDMVKT